MLAAASAPRGRPSKAERDQLTADELDVILVDLARANNRLVAWWWGTRARDERSGAFCYICDDWIVNYSRNWPVTLEAKKAIHAHRAVHLADVQKRRGQSSR